MFHLPDLPNAGYATQREKQLTDSIMVFMRDVERDRLRLLTIVVEGIDKWRRVCESLWRGLGVTREEVDNIYRYFLLQAARPRDQVRLLEASCNVERYRDVVRDVLPDIEAQLEQVRRLPRGVQ